MTWEHCTRAATTRSTMLWTPTRELLNLTQATLISRQGFSCSEMGPTMAPALLLCPPMFIPRHTNTKVQLDPQARSGQIRALVLSRLNHLQVLHLDPQATGRALQRSILRLNRPIRMSSAVSLSGAQLLGRFSNASPALVKSNR